MGLVCALSAPALAQPAPPAAGAPAARPTAPNKASRKRARAAKPAPIDIAPLVAQLAGTDHEAAAQAAAALGATTDPAAHDALLDALALGLPPSVAIAAITALSAHRAPTDVTALVRYASHRNPAVRSAALGALAMYPAPDARQAVLRGLHDMTASVRDAAAAAAARARIRESVEPLFALLARGEDSASKALAAMADPGLARKLGDELGKVPDAVLATTLGRILVRSDFGPDAARVEIVRAIGKIQDPAAVAALTDYLDAVPKQPPRASRTEAQKMVQARMGGN